MICYAYADRLSSKSRSEYSAEAFTLTTVVTHRSRNADPVWKGSVGVSSSSAHSHSSSNNSSSSHTNSNNNTDDSTTATATTIAAATTDDNAATSNGIVNGQNSSSSSNSTTNNSEHSDAQSAAVRQLLLAEMYARAVKQLTRLSLRCICEGGAPATSQAQFEVISGYLNVATGSHPRADLISDEQITAAIVQRFGAAALDPQELIGLRTAVRPSIRYVVTRLQCMLGFSLSAACASQFEDHPMAFCFTAQDLCGSSSSSSGSSSGTGSSCAAPPVIARVKHNVPLLPLAQAACLAAAAAALQRRSSYVTLVREHCAVFYLPLQERRGSRVAVNLGTGGVPLCGYYEGGVKHERVGPLLSNNSGSTSSSSSSGSSGGGGGSASSNRAVRLTPEGKGRVDTKRTADTLAPPSMRRYDTLYSCLYIIKACAVCVCSNEQCEKAVVVFTCVTRHLTHASQVLRTTAKYRVHSTLYRVALALPQLKSFRSTGSIIST
jgi:hypothetical protein